MPDKISPCLLYKLMLSMLVFGSANTVFLKMMNLSYFTDKDGVRKQFYHAFFQTFIMFIGAFLCIGVYEIIYFRDIRKYEDYENLPQVDEAKRKGKKTRINILILFIPPPALISFHQLFGGVAIAGASPLIFKDDEKKQENTNTVLEIALIIIAQFFTPAFMVVEEKLPADYMLHPLKIVGLEGLWGLAIYIMLLIIFQFIECGNKDICPNGRLRYSSGFPCNGKNPMIICYAVGSILSVAFYMSLGVTVTKYASATQRVTIDISRTLVIWGVFLAKPGDGHERFI
ncbi:unnamed protein product [Moneuplotes crassus]|uniref:Uncharacterized protein n=1 Tax=Euplotes crassus TaxID=5936 RepID=A0AAD1UPZ0_EUPCR|nr:unnamed protein product [Moneuplotes crassus]